MTVTVALGNNPTGATLLGQATRTGNIFGITFNNMTIDKAGNGYTFL